MKDKLYIVGNFIRRGNDGIVTWVFEGVFDSEEKAKEACIGKNYFIGPVPLNSALSPGKIDNWPGCYYPNLQGE